jgi:hypothetical protein
MAHPIIPVLSRLRQENLELEVSLEHTVSFRPVWAACISKKKKKYIYICIYILPLS